MRRTIFHKAMRRDAGNVDLTVWGVADHVIMGSVYYARAREPVGLWHGKRENTKRKKKRGMLPSRRRRCEKVANEGGTGCLQMLGNGGVCSATFARECSQASRVIRAWQVE